MEASSASAIIGGETAVPSGYTFCLVYGLVEQSWGILECWNAAVARLAEIPEWSFASVLVGPHFVSGSFNGAIVSETPTIVCRRLSDDTCYEHRVNYYDCYTRDIVEAILVNMFSEMVEDMN